MTIALRVKVPSSQQGTHSTLGSWYERYIHGLHEGQRKSASKAQHSPTEYLYSPALS